MEQDKKGEVDKRGMEIESTFAQIVQWRNASMVRMMSGVRFSLWAHGYKIIS